MGNLFKSTNIASTSARVSSFMVTSSTHGSPIKIIFGTTMIAPVLIDYDDFTAIANTTTTSSGGKGGSVKSSNTTYTYTVMVLMALGEGVLTGTGSIWEGSKVTDASALNLTFFNGSIAQNAWGYLLTKHPTKALTYSGTSYLAGILNLGDSISLPNYNIEVYGLCQSNQSAPSTVKMIQSSYLKTVEISNWSSNINVQEYVYGSSGNYWTVIDSRYYTVAQKKDASGNNIAGTYVYTFNFDDRTDGYDRSDPLYIRVNYNAITASISYTATDANPRDIVEKVLSSTVFGANFPTVLIDNLSDFASYCNTNSILVSPVYDSQQQTSDIITDLMETTNSAYVFSQGKVKIIPYYDGLTSLYDITDDNLLDQGDDTLVITRTSQSDIYNVIPLEYYDRSNQYNTGMVYATDEGDIDLHGLRQSSTKSHHEICTAALAQTVSQTILQKQLYIRNTYVIKVDQSFVLLEPMDPNSLVSELTGLPITDVRVVSIKESKDDYSLEITFENNPSGVMSPATYETQEVNRASLNLEEAPGNINTPIIFEPPAQLITTNLGLETWMGASGGPNWGGCYVWLSSTHENFKRIGEITSPCRQGIITAALAQGPDPDTANIASVDLTMSEGSLSSGTQSDADSFSTLCYLGGELISYETATLTAINKYNLSYLRRGVYDTYNGEHPIDSSFVRLDSNRFFKYAEDSTTIGQTYYLKFTSYNIYGAAEQNLSDVVEYAHTVSAVTVPQVTDLIVYQHLRGVLDGTNVYELEVKWTSPTTILYSYSDIYLKTSQPNWDEDQVNTSWEDMGDTVTFDDLTEVLAGQEGWKYIGKATDKITIPDCVTGQTFTIKVQAVSLQKNFRADFETAPLIVHEVKIKSYLPSVPSNFIVSFTSICTWSWDDNSDTDNDFYEVRSDTNTGMVTGRIAKTSSNKAIGLPPTRSGTAYLYAHNTSGNYSFPATISYNKPQPVAPTVTITSVFQGLLITTNSIPTDCAGISAHIDNGTGSVIYTSSNNAYTFKTTGGIFSIQVAFVDLFGEGILSAEQEFTVIPTIDPALIAAESLSLAKMDTTIKAAVAAAQVSIDTTTFNNAINNKVDNSAFNTAIAGRVSYTDFNNEVNTLVQVDSTNASAISQTASKLTSTIAVLNSSPGASGQYTSISQLKQTADGISSTVQSNKSAQDTVNSSTSSQISQNASKITSVVTELNKSVDTCSYTSIVQALTAINLRASKANLISQINICPEAITIDGKYIHVTGDTVFDNNVIVGRMLAAQSISSDKIAAGSITAEQIKAGSIDAASLKENGIDITNLIANAWMPQYRIYYPDNTSTGWITNYPLSYPSRGGIQISLGSNGNPYFISRMMFTLYVDCSAATSVNQMIRSVDDSLEVYVNQVLKYTLSSGSQQTVITHNLVAGINLIQFVLINYGGPVQLVVLGDIINNTTIKYHEG